MNKIELLAPAGNLEILKVAIDNGADAVYIGGENYSARAYADNFDNQQIIEGIKYAHIKGSNRAVFKFQIYYLLINDVVVAFVYAFAVLGIPKHPFHILVCGSRFFRGRASEP